jgi:hypothetical protein
MAVSFRTDFGPEKWRQYVNCETLVPTHRATRCHSSEDHNMKSGRMACIDSELILKRRILKVFIPRSFRASHSHDMMFLRTTGIDNL